METYIVNIYSGDLVVDSDTFKENKLKSRHFPQLLVHPTAVWTQEERWLLVSLYFSSVSKGESFGVSK